MKLTFTILLLCLFVCICRAQTVNSFNYDTEQGLPSSDVYSVCQADDGMLWFSSDRGVFSYNGYAFKTYTSKDGLGHNTCFDICKRGDGSLWFMGYDGSVSVYSSGRFTVHRQITDFVKKHFPADWVEFCEFGEGKIFFCMTSTRYAYVYNEADASFKLLARPRMLNTGTSLVLGKSEFVVNPLFSSLKVPSRLFARVHSLNGQDAYTVNGSFVYHLKRVAGEWRYADSIDMRMPLNAKNILLTGSGLLISGTEGLYRCRFGTAPERLLERVNITQFIRDKEGNYWASSLGSGVVKVPSVDILTYKLLEGNYTSVYRDSNMLAAGSNTGAVCIDETGGTRNKLFIRDFVAVEQIMPMSRNFIFGLKPIHKTRSRWAVLPEEKSFVGLRIVPMDKESYLYCNNNILYRYKNNKKYALNKAGSLHVIRSLYYDGKILWIGTLKGLFSAELRGDSIVNTREYASSYPELGGRVNDIKAFRNGFLLSVFGKGLVYFDGRQSRVISYRKGEDEMLLNRILVADSLRVMLMTNNGLVFIRFRNSNTFEAGNSERFDINNGLSSNFINDASLYRDTLWLATNKGIDRFPMSLLEHGHVVPFVNIDGLMLKNNLYPYSRHLYLKASENSFNIIYEGISFRKPLKSYFFRYALTDGSDIDTQWYYTNEKALQFVNISPGTYTFLISAHTNNSGWSPNSIMKITVAPPFTGTWWFAGLCILSLVALLYLLFNRRVRNIKKQNEQVRKVELLELKYKESELMALQNQMNPHFIFNCLNSIQRYIITNHFEQANNYITRFARLMRSSLSMSKLEFIGLGKEIEFITTYLDLEQMRFSNLFEYDISISGDIDIENIRMPTLLVQPLLENAIKHGFKDIESGGRISISIKLEGAYLKIEVCDNGKGIEKPELIMAGRNEQSFGLSIVRQRIHLLKERTGDTGIVFEITAMKQGVRASIIIPSDI